MHAKASHVHACEWNPNAVEALKKNLEANGVSDRCTIHQGDNRQVKLIDLLYLMPHVVFIYYSFRLVPWEMIISSEKVHL